jgi:hypothetical protein
MTTLPVGHEYRDILTDSPVGFGLWATAERCQCGEVFSATSFSLPAAQDLIRKRFRKHIRRVARVESAP